MTRKQAEKELLRTKQFISIGIRHWETLSEDRKRTQSLLHHRVSLIEDVLMAFDNLDKAIKKLENHDLKGV